MKEKFISAVFLILLCAMPLAAQSTAQEIETLLATEAVTYAQAARLLLEASDTFATFDPQEAFNYAKEQKWLPKKVTADTIARLDIVSLLAVSSFKMKGGSMYSIFRPIGITYVTAHFAYRVLKIKNIIQGRTNPSSKVSGRQLLFITEKMLSQSETGN